MSGKLISENRCELVCAVWGLRIVGKLEEFFKLQRIHSLKSMVLMSLPALGFRYKRGEEYKSSKDSQCSASVTIKKCLEWLTYKEKKSILAHSFWGFSLWSFGPVACGLGSRAAMDERAKPSIYLKVREKRTKKTAFPHYFKGMSPKCKTHPWRFLTPSVSTKFGPVL